ncbi:hypothetical protein D1872_285740 [compost metagenome]
MPRVHIIDLLMLRIDHEVDRREIVLYKLAVYIEHIESAVQFLNDFFGFDIGADGVL